MSDSVWPHRWQPTRLPCPWDSPGKNIGVGCHFLLQCMKVKSESEVAQSCPTLSDPMDCSPPGSSVHGIFQARELEWGAIAFSISTCTGYQLSWKLHARQFLTSQSLNIWTSGIEHPKTDSIMDDTDTCERQWQLPFVFYVPHWKNARFLNILKEVIALINLATTSLCILGHSTDIINCPHRGQKSLECQVAGKAWTKPHAPTHLPYLLHTAHLDLRSLGK